MSYEQEVAAIYDLYCPVDRNPEADVWAALAGPEARDLLEPMAGSAEVAQLLARRGFRVTGVELSPGMVAVAHKRLAAAEPAVAGLITLLEGDIARVPLPAGAFDFAYVGSGSWNLLTAPLDRIAALRSICRALRPGGRLALKLFKPFTASGRSEPRTFQPLRPHPEGIPVEKSSFMVRDAATGRVEIHESIHIGGRTLLHDLALQVLTPSQVESELREAGFTGVDCYGDEQCSPYTAESGDLFVIARVG